MTTLSDVEQALINARVLQNYWVSNGWESLEVEDTPAEILDIYPLVEVDISVTVTIKLSNKTYVVPLEDVSPLSINDCLVIEISDLYLDWEERVKSRLGHCFYEGRFTKDGEDWHESRYLDLEGTIRVVKAKTVWETLSY